MEKVKIYEKVKISTDLRNASIITMIREVSKMADNRQIAFKEIFSELDMAGE